MELHHQRSIKPGVSPNANFYHVLHQAAGVVSEQLNISGEEALMRLRASAFRTDRLVADIADDVVNRRLCIGPLSTP